MRIACLATNDFEDSELGDPKAAMEGAGHEVVVISPALGQLKGKKGKVTVQADRTIDGVQPEEFDALFIPGGYSPDQLRADPRFVDFTSEFAELDRPIFAICHGPQLLLAADALEGRKVTAWKTVQDDLRRAHIDVSDEAVVVDGNLITSRQPSDIPAFNEALLKALETEPTSRRRTENESRAVLQ
jgi:protease I